jgi:hypothetical protein
MRPVHGINPQITTAQTHQKSEAGKAASNTTGGINFGSVLAALQKSMNGVMAVADKNSAPQAQIHKEKLEKEQKKLYETDLDQAQDLLKKIAKIIGEQEGGKKG